MVLEAENETFFHDEDRGEEESNPTISYRVLLIISKGFRQFFVDIPCIVTRIVPHSDAVMSILFLYIFIQMMGYLWLLLASIVSAWVVDTVNSIGSAGSSYFSSDMSSFFELSFFLCRRYINYCCFRLLFFGSQAVYHVGWESFYEFPTIRKLLATSLMETYTMTGATLSIGGVSQMLTGSPMKEISITSSPLRPLPLYANLQQSPLKRMSEEEGEKESSTKSSLTPVSRLEMLGGAEKSMSSTARLRVSPDKANVPRTHSEDLRTTTTKTDKEAKEKEEEEAENNRGGRGLRLRRPRSDDEVIRSECIHAASAKEYAPRPYDYTCSALSPKRRTWNLTENQRIRLRRAKQLTLIVPLLILTILLLIFFILCIFESKDEMMAPDSRLQRILRFASLISFFQWATQYFLVFPRWYDAIYVFHWKSLIPLCFLSAIGAFRLVTWLLFPTGDGRRAYFLYIPIYVFDASVVLCWMLWMLYAVTRMVTDPKVLKMSGYEASRFEDDAIWRDHIILFKYGLLSGICIHFVRGIFSPRIGFSNSQCDQIVFSFVYPVMLCVIWSITFTMSRIRFSKIKMFGLALLIIIPTAYAICKFAEMDNMIAVTVVICHMIRQLQKSPSFANRRKAGLDFVGPRGGISVANKAVLYAYGGIVLAFTLLTVALTLMSKYQESHNFYVPTIAFRDGPEDIYINHVISHLTLTKGDKMEKIKPPRYSICSLHRKKLSPVDFVLLSELAYFEKDQITEVMNGFFPNSTNLPWELRSSNSGSEARLVWYEIWFPTLNTTVFSVRGTDASKTADILEDIRMWTESTGIGLLSILFPTVRLWTKKSTEMVIYGLHAIINIFTTPSEKNKGGKGGSKEERWGYQRLLDTVKRFPKDAEVILTGHSMGGSMAGIVGTLAHYPVFSVQPPGIYHSIAKHQSLHDPGLSYEMLHHEQTTIVVEGDWINNAFDNHGGLVQNIGCDRPDMSMLNSCHMLEGTLCHLLDHCGDHRNRWSKCQWDFTSPIVYALELIWAHIGSVSADAYFYPLIMIILVILILYFGL